MVEVLLSGSGRSEVLVSRAPRILRGDFRPSFQLKYAAKDVGLAVSMARLAGAPVPLATVLHQLYQSAAAAGQAEQDFSALLVWLEGQTGAPVRARA